jgi:aminopeptidase N
LPGLGAAQAIPHHDITFSLEPGTGEIVAEDMIILSGPDSVEFTLGTAFPPSHILVDGAPVPSTSTHSGHITRWRLAPGKSPGARRLLIRYRGKVEGLRTLDHRGVLGGLPPMASPRGSFLPGGTGWYPDFGHGPFTYRVHLDLPADQRGLVPGRLVAERQEQGRYQATFAFDRPARDIDLIAGPYQTQERFLPRPGANPIRLRTYFHPEVASLAADYLDSLGHYIEMYSRWIGAYPFTEFSVVSSPLPTGFGMATLTYLGVDVLRLPFIRSTSLGHEVLHNWWGNGVYVDYETGNWSEGLTAFMADYTYKEQEGPEAAREMRLSWLRDVAAIPAARDIPLQQFTARTHGTSQIVGYHKSAFLFLMLRDLIGKDAFDAGVRSFWRDRQFQRAGWPELQRAFEAASGQTLRRFFDQWLSRPGAPRLRIERAGLERAGAGYRVRLSLAQDGPVYSLRVPVDVIAGSGHAPHVLDVSQGRQEFVLETAARPAALLLDPEFRLLRHLGPGEAPPILRQLIIDAATLTVVPGQDAAVRDAALQLAGRLLDHPPRLVAGGPQATAAPLLLVGLARDVDAALQYMQLPGRPDRLGTRGTAQVWTATQPNGKALAVVSAESADALLALLRPLPHYGRQSYLVFEGATAVERGIWPSQSLAWQFPPID